MPKRTEEVYGDKATKVAHDARNNDDQCRKSEIKPSNRQSFASLGAAVEAGYRPCKSCYPKDSSK